MHACCFQTIPHFQVTVQYKRKGNVYKPMFVHTIVISAMHQKGVSLDAQREELKEKVVKVSVRNSVLCICVHMHTYIRTYIAI